jgi:hypothetical protein
MKGDFHMKSSEHPDTPEKDISVHLECNQLKESDPVKALFEPSVRPLPLKPVGKSRGGKKKFTLKNVRRLLKALSNGLTIGQACKATGIGTSTLHDWQVQYPDFDKLLEEAREQAREKALAAIKEIADKQDDYRAWESFLKYSFQADYRQGGNINVNASATVQPVIINEAERARLTAQRQELCRGVDAVDALPSSQKVIEATIIDQGHEPEQSPAGQAESKEVKATEGPSREARALFGDRAEDAFASQELLAAEEDAAKRGPSQEESFIRLCGDPDDR